MLLLVLVACATDVAPARPALSLDIVSPTRGAFVGDDGVLVEGVVTPADAQIIVNDVHVRPDADGRFRTTLTFPAGAHAMVADVFALDGGARLHERIPVFDGDDPRAADPGAVTGLLTRDGLADIAPLVAEQIDALDWEGALLAGLPAIRTGIVDIVPTAVTADASEVVLDPGLGDVGLLVTLPALTLVSEVTVAGFTFPLALTSTLTLGGRAAPLVDADGYLSLALTGAEIAFTDPGFAAIGIELPSGLADLLLDPAAQLLTAVADGLGDALVTQIPELELGGPFAFDVDLLGTTLGARLVEVGATPDGLDLGVTVAAGEPAARALPEDLTPLLPVTPRGRPYDLGFALHEGVLNVVLDQVLGNFLDLDLPLSGGAAQVFGGGIASLPGGDELPEDIDGYCIGLHAGDARVVRFEAGDGAPLARAWLPDLTVDLELLRNGDCDPWLSAAVEATLDLSIDGTTVSADLDVRDAQVLAYGAKDARWDDTGDALEGVVEGLAGLLAGQLSFDLGDALGGALPLQTRIIEVAPLADGRWAVFTEFVP